MYHVAREIFAKSKNGKKAEPTDEFYKADVADKKNIQQLTDRLLAARADAHVSYHSHWPLTLTFTEDQFHSMLKTIWSDPIRSDQLGEPPSK